MRFRAIITSKMLKGKAGIIGGIAYGQGNSECGSFFNKGDNRVLRTVYKEDIPSQSVSSLSFNPVKWVCAALSERPSNFRGEGEGRRTVVVIANQNFPGLLPSAEGNCLAIIRLEKGCQAELVDFAINITKSVTVPFGTVFLVGSLNHLEKAGTQSNAAACIIAKRRLQKV
jgi:hypothetical protein